MRLDREQRLELEGEASWSGDYVDGEYEERRCYRVEKRRDKFFDVYEPWDRWGEMVARAKRELEDK